ncbi:MAG: hypothetical protein U5L72_01405 [Bacteroidales bacterium]|nr:hypothetical protein [Bacteroidales bacterium]
MQQQTSRERGAPIMSVAGSNKTISPGFSGGLSIRYSLSDLISIGLNSEYTGTRTGISYYDGKTRKTTNKKVPAQNLVTAITLSFNMNKGKTAQPLVALSNPQQLPYIPVKESGTDTSRDNPGNVPRNTSGETPDNTSRDTDEDTSDEDPRDQGFVFLPRKL